MAAAVEHRCAWRQPVQIHAILISPARGPLPAMVTNLSGGGLYAELERDERPPGVCAMVDVVVAGGPDSFRWPAMVVHREGCGVGLMFDHSHAADVYRLLRGGGASRAVSPA